VARVRVVCQRCNTGLEREVPTRAPRTAPGIVPPLLTRCPKCREVVLVDDPNLGHVVNGKWKLTERLGSGGMGTVYRAEDLSVGRAVAVKFLHAALLKDADAVHRFEQESRNMARVDHPNLVHLYAVERDGQMPCIVMKYVEGRRLSTMFREKRRMTVAEVLPLVVQIGGALSALHAQGFIHRDLKPGNVMLAPDGFATLLDFGLMRSMNTSMTRPGTILGTPHYMSPEQASGSTNLDGRSDLYSLAVLTTELLAGQLPFAIEPTGEMLASRVTEDPRPPHLLNSQITRPMSDVLLKAMSRRPADRYPDVDSFLDALIDAANVGPVGLPRRKPAELKLVSGKAPAWPPVAPVLSPVQLEELGLSSDDLSQVPDADVVSITDPEANGPSSTQPEEETQAAKLVDVKQALDEVSDRTLDPELASAAAATAMQTTTPALKRVRDTAPSGQRALSDEKTVLAPRRAPSRAAPPPARPVGVWVVLLTTALGLGALVAWLVTR
jgi:serine/threonine-protein kinase